jgi:hypothetical protein
VGDQLKAVIGAKHGQNFSFPRMFANQDLKAKRRRLLLMFKPCSFPVKVIGMVSYSQTLLIVLKVKKEVFFNG